jgi:hypothetical protein
MNPKCRKELHYLRNGRVIRTTSRAGSTVKVEHFWLCGECHVEYDFNLSNDGGVSLISRPKFMVVEAKPVLDLMLVS